MPPSPPNFGENVLPQNWGPGGVPQVIEMIRKSLEICAILD